MEKYDEVFETDGAQNIFDPEHTNILRINFPIPSNADPRDVAYALVALANKYAGMALRENIRMTTEDMPTAIATEIFGDVDDGDTTPVIVPAVLQLKHPDERDDSMMRAFSIAVTKRMATQLADND